MDDDIDLANALLNSDGKAALSFTETDRRAGQPARPRARATCASSRSTPATDCSRPTRAGVIRRVAYELDDLQSLGVVAAEIATGRKVSRADFPDDGAWIDYYGGPGTLKHVSFSDVFENKIPRGFFRDKNVVVGPSAPTLQDVHATSTTDSNERCPAARSRRRCSTRCGAACHCARSRPGSTTSRSSCRPAHAAAELAAATMWAFVIALGAGAAVCGGGVRCSTRGTSSRSPIR